jgi:hypothetical protein
MNKPSRDGANYISASSHKIWDIRWLDHNASLIGKQMLGPSTSTIFHTTLTSSTELSTETVGQGLFIESGQNGALPGNASKGSPVTD